MSSPKFGHEMLKQFVLDPDYINLNNGSYGSPPRAVLDYAHKLTDEIEKNPDMFFRLKYQKLLFDVRESLAKMIGAEKDEVVIITNASVGVTTVLRNLEWHPEDVILVFSTTYNSISRTAEYVSHITPNPQLSVFDLRFPTTHADIITNFTEHIKGIETTGRKVAIIDSIISNPGYLLPWEKLVAIAKDAGFLTVVDAAHSIGQQTNINLAESQPDFWISNCHKWLYAKRSAAVFYIPKRNQHLIKSTIPTSYMYRPQTGGEHDIVKQFEWNGTIDFVPYFTVAEALRFRESLGGEKVINDYCHSLAVEGGKVIAKIMGTELLDPKNEGTLNMVNIELPLRGSLGLTPEIDMAFKRKLLVEHNAYVAHYYHNNRWWARCSAQVWNELEDFEKMGKILVQVCKEIENEFGNNASSN